VFIDKSLGYGFALFESGESARLAVRALHRRRVGNKTLVCRLSRSEMNLERTPDAARASNRLFVRGFPQSFTNGN
jgi:hypothetical protein